MDESNCRSRVRELSGLEARGGAVGCLSHNSEAFDLFGSDAQVQRVDRTATKTDSGAGNGVVGQPVPHTIVQWLITPPRLVAAA